MKTPHAKRLASGCTALTFCLLGCSTDSGLPKSRDVGASLATKHDICEFMAVHFDRTIDEFERVLGPVKSSILEQKYGDEAHGGIGKIMRVEFADEVSIGYVVGENLDRELITDVMAKGIDALRKFDLDVYTAQDVQALLGAPDGVQGNVMVYGCVESDASLELDPTNSTLSVSQHVSIN